MIIFDSERMRYANTGLHTFCHQLGLELVARKQDINHPLAAYAPAALAGVFGPGCSYLPCLSRHRYWLRPQGCDLWHSTYQLTHFFPRGVPVLQTVHDLNFLHEDISQRKRWEYTRRLRRHLRRAVAVVAISDYVRRDLLQHIDLPDLPVHVISNGCSEYHGALEQPAGMTGVPFLFSVGTLLPKKNFHVLPCLLRGNDLHLYIAGCDYGASGHILSEARRWGVEQRVHLMGAVSESVKHWMLCNCLALVFPSLAEGFGLPVVEAMQYGRPVFISDHTCLPEIGGEAAYYFPHDFEPAAMQTVLENGLNDFLAHRPEREAALIERARSFSWGEAARQYIELYNLYT